MAEDLYAVIEKITDENSFLEFVALLADDWQEERDIESTKPSSPYSSGALGWENGTIGAFLDASYRWGSATINGLTHYKKPDNPWQRMAQLLHAGKFYE
jgi:hypothetical protein